MTGGGRRATSVGVRDDALLKARETMRHSCRRRAHHVTTGNGDLAARDLVLDRDGAALIEAVGELDFGT